MLFLEQYSPSQHRGSALLQGWSLDFPPWIFHLLIITYQKSRGSRHSSPILVSTELVPGPRESLLILETRIRLKVALVGAWLAQRVSLAQLAQWPSTRIPVPGRPFAPVPLMTSVGSD
jgi:hypothetical protein